VLFATKLQKLTPGLQPKIIFPAKSANSKFRQNIDDPPNGNLSPKREKQQWHFSEKKPVLASNHPKSHAGKRFAMMKTDNYLTSEARGGAQRKRPNRKGE